MFDAGERQGSAGIDDITGKPAKPAPGQHADLLVTSPKGFTSTVICRGNFHPDNTPLLPRDNQLKVIPGGLVDGPTTAPAADAKK